MLPTTLPNSYDKFKDFTWSQIKPQYQELSVFPLTNKNIAGWLVEWTKLKNLIEENRWRKYIAINMDTTDQQADAAYHQFIDSVYSFSLAADQRLKEKLLISGLNPPSLEIPLRKLRWEVELFRNENMPLLSQELKLSNQLDKIIGAQSILWEGKETSIPQLQRVYQNTDRQVREQAWRMASQRQLDDRKAIDNLWVMYMHVRGQLAHNVGMKDFRAYMWKKLLRFFYSPEDCYRFHRAIKEVVVPEATRIYKRRQQQLGIPSIRPWDNEVDALNRPPLRPFKSGAELESTTARIFHKVDKQLGEYFELMRQEKLLDLDNRIGKVPGGMCVEYRASKRPFIIMNAVGVHDDVQTLLHEGGHAFHVFETNHHPYHLQNYIPMEFSEVASTAMEFLGGEYLESDQGGFYSTKDAARARADYLERMILFWPYMAVVDAFQQWVYDNHEMASIPKNCDAKWADLWRQFIPGEDWSGFESAMETGWQRKLHIHQDPFYYIEYGLSQLGAVQIWHNAMRDQPGAVAAYCKALSLGGTVTLPELYKTAGAKLAFDSQTLGEAVSLMVAMIEKFKNI